MNEQIIRWTAGLSFVAALWLVFSPLWIHYTSSGNATTQVIVGIIVGILAIVKLSAPTMTWPSGFNFLAGIWFIIAPFVLASTTAVKWNQVVLGIIVAGLATLELTAMAEPAATATDSGRLSSRESSMTFGEKIPDSRDRNEKR